jgi:hypothetical protein
MARFLAYDDIVSRELLSPADVQWIAGQIASLSAFEEGTAVLCGSVSWGTHSWRSDIDVAHFRTTDHPALEDDIKDVLEDFDVRTSQRYVAPRIDVIVIGEELAGLTESLEKKRKKRESTGNLSIEIEPSSLELTDQIFPKVENGTRMFPDAVDRFADHIGSIARMKGDPWRSFFERYLAVGRREAEEQRAALNSYVTAITEAWTRQPLHALSRAADGSFTPAQLDLLGRAENYPVNLMRRVLATLGKYPIPDRASDIKVAFAKLAHPWAQRIIAALPAFAALGEEYESMVVSCKRPEGKLPTREEFHERINTVAGKLPFNTVQEAVWEYLGG